MNSDRIKNWLKHGRKRSVATAKGSGCRASPVAPTNAPGAPQERVTGISKG